MTRDPYDRRRKTKIVIGVLTVGILMSLVVALGIIYLGQGRPRF